MSQESSLIPTWGIAAPGATGYQVPEGKSELVNRNSIIFTIGRSISLIGDGFYLQTLVVWGAAFTLANATTPAQRATAPLVIAGIQATILASYYLGNFLIVPFASIFADRLNRRSVMITANLVQAVLSLLPLGAFLAARGLFLPTIYISFFILNGFAGLFVAAQGGALQVIVSRRTIPQAISILYILFGVGNVLGAVFASPFFLAVGPIIAILFNAATFVVSAISLALIRMPDQALNPRKYQPTGTVTGAAIGKALKELGQGFRFTFTTRVLLACALMIFVGALGGSAIQSSFSGFFFANLHANPRTDLALLGLLPAALYAGGIIGSLLLGILEKFIPLKMLVTGSVVLLGLDTVVAAFQTSVIAGVIFFLGLGILEYMFETGYNALIFKVTPNIIVGRVLGSLAPIVYFTGFLGAIFIGGFVHANTGDPISFFRNIFLAGGALIVVGGMIGVWMMRGAQEQLAETASQVVPAAATATEGVGGE